MTDLAWPVRVLRLEGAHPTPTDDWVAHEEPLELQVNGASVAVLMRTPGADVELGLGFLLTEGIITAAGQVESIRHCTTAPDPEAEDNILQVRLVQSAPFELARFKRHMFASSSCGVCGKATLAQAMAVAGALPAPNADPSRGFVLSAPVLLAFGPKLGRDQPGFARTGGLHAAGLFDANGTCVVVHEDVGRHNAVDKVIGHALSVGLDLSMHALMVSGRTSFEVVQKALAARIPFVAGVSAPSSLAVRLARDSGMTLAGFLRGSTVNLYAGAARVVADAGRANAGGPDDV